CNVLCFPPEALALPMPSSNPEALSLCEQQCHQLLARLGKRSHFVDDVRRRIMKNPGRFPSLDQVAEALAISPRTLRRRLDEEGQRFQEILDGVRFEVAQSYLLDTALPIEHIAELLGFNYSGNFSHAFKRWSGESPRQFRENRAKPDHNS
ncbi:MAG: helix-turn-helix transcriptional regulator, partial [Parahaliea sp.]